MASKLRRTPLFGYDGNLGIPMAPPKKSAAAAAPAAAAASVGNGYNQVREKEPISHAIEPCFLSPKIIAFRTQNQRVEIMASLCVFMIFLCDQVSFV